MPSVPRLTTSSVETIGLGSPRAQAPSADASGAQLGQALSGASGQIFAMAKQELAEIDASRINKAESDYEAAKVKFLHDPNEGLFRITGEAAVNPADGKTLDDRTREWQKRYKEESMLNLGNDRQKQLFNAYMDKDAPSLSLSVMNHTVKQGQIVKIGNAKAATNTMTDTAIMVGSDPSIDPAEFTKQIAGLKDKVEVQALLEGFGATSDYTKNLLSEKVSKVFASIVTSKINNDDDAGAVAFYNENKDLITDAAERKRLEPVIQKITSMNEGKEVAGGIWKELRPKSVNDVLDLETMRELVRTMEGSDMVKAFAEKRVEELAQEYQQQKRLNEESASNRIYGMANKEKAGYSKIVKAIEIDQNIDDRTKENLLSWADHKFRISEGRAEAKASAKQQQQLGQLSKLLSFQQEYMQGKYGTLTPSQVAAQAGKLGQFTDNAMQFVDNVNKDLGKAKVTDSDLMDTVRVLRQNKDWAKLLPATEKPTDVDKAKMALLQGKVHELMAQSNTAPGKGMTIKEATLKAIEGVKTYTSFFGDTVDPLYTLGSDMSSKYGKSPAKWPKDTQNKVISDLFYSNPANKGKRLDFATMERYRAELVRGK